jgi:hypothetical protein
MDPTYAEAQTFDPFMGSACESPVGEVGIVADMDQQPPSPSPFNTPITVPEAAPENWAAELNVNFEECTLTGDEFCAEADSLTDIDYQDNDEEPVHLALSPRFMPVDDETMTYEAEEEPVEMALSPSVIFLTEDMEQVDDEPVEFALSPPALSDDEDMHCQVSYPMPSYASQPQFFEQAFLRDNTANQHQNLAETMDYGFIA